MNKSLLTLFVCLFVVALVANVSALSAVGDPVGCVNSCGNGICDAIVCQGPNCPCAETAQSCPADCTCAREGEHFSKVYPNYPQSCCSGLTEWQSGMDTRKVVNGVCVQTNLISGNPVGTCLNCGNGICENIENVCNCPADCQSTQEITETFNASKGDRASYTGRFGNEGDCGVFSQPEWAYDGNWDSLNNNGILQDSAGGTYSTFSTPPGIIYENFSWRNGFELGGVKLKTKYDLGCDGGSSSIEIGCWDYGHNNWTRVLFKQCVNQVSNIGNTETINIPSGCVSNNQSIRLQNSFYAQPEDSGNCPPTSYANLYENAIVYNKMSGQLGNLGFFARIEEFFRNLF
jgi:hypothetical protein